MLTTHHVLLYRYHSYATLQGARGTALGFYNWGIYIGYSVAFAFNFILLAIGWRWVFWIASMPGFVIGGVVLFTVKEPERRKNVSVPH